MGNSDVVGNFDVAGQKHAAYVLQACGLGSAQVTSPGAHSPSRSMSTRQGSLPVGSHSREIDNTRGTSLGGVPREQEMLKGHLTRVIHHQVY